MVVAINERPPPKLVLRRQPKKTGVYHCVDCFGTNRRRGDGVVRAKGTTRHTNKVPEFSTPRRHKRNHARKTSMKNNVVIFYGQKHLKPTRLVKKKKFLDF